MVKRYLLVSVILCALLSVAVFGIEVKGGTVLTESGVNFRKEASTEAEVLDVLYDGERLAIIAEEGEWLKAATGGVIGFIHSDYIELQDIMNITPGGAKVTTAVLNLRSEPNSEAEILARLTESTVVKIIGINTGWYKVDTGSQTGYIHPDYVEIVPYTAVTTKAASSGTKSSSSSSGGGQAVVTISDDVEQARKDIVDYAASFLGVKYVYGGSSPKGFDCSGFTHYVFAHFDISLQRTASSQYSSSVKKIDKSELQVGDLVFFSNGSKGKVGHVGIYVGGGDFIHASSPGDVVKYDTIESGYYNRNYIGAGTVIS